MFGVAAAVAGIFALAFAMIGPFESHHVLTVAQRLAYCAVSGRPAPDRCLCRVRRHALPHAWAYGTPNCGGARAGGAGDRRTLHGHHLHRLRSVRAPAPVAAGPRLPDYQGDIFRGRTAAARRHCPRILRAAPARVRPPGRRRRRVCRNAPARLATLSTVKRPGASRCWCHVVSAPSDAPAVLCPGAEGHAATR